MLKKILGLILIVCFPTMLFAVTQNIDVQADSFEFDGKTQEILASGNVKVSQKDVLMTGKVARYRQQDQKINLLGPVQIVKGPMNLTCESVLAYGKEEKIEASGKVKFRYNRIQGESDFAVFNRNDHSVLLSGNPKAWQGADQISGNLIKIDLKKEKVTTQGKARVILSVDTLQQKNQ